MCGLCGEFTTREMPADVAAVARMTDTMTARGPDGAGAWSHGPIALGHRRLKVIDLSDLAAQPMVDADLGVAVAFNGCIYNYAELRTELEAAGHRFTSSGDTEVLLKAYRAWGDGFVDRLQGMFAFALYDLRSGGLLLGRDRLGIKPLYLDERPDRIRFASTLPALLAGGGVDTRIDPVALHHYLSFHSVVPAPRTILRGVRRLPPATLLRIDADGTRRQWRYWEPVFERVHDRTPEEWSDAVREALRLAVRRRLVADVPVGCLLSGGLDSSLIVGLLAEEGQHGLQTFSVGFDSVDGIEGDEFRYSDIVAERFATDHHRIRVGTERLLPALGDAVAAMSEPMVSHDVVAFHLLSQEVARHVKVVQSGQGADEVFGGYHWYPPLAETTGTGVTEYADAFFDRTHAGIADLVAPEHRIEDDASRDLVREHFGRPGSATAVDRALRLDTEIMLTDDPVKRVDNMTMAWGLEARVPFLDHELVELAATIPPEVKLAQGGKGVLKEAARAVIPAEVIDRPKGYFPVPALTHLHGPYLDLVRDALSAPEARARGLFRAEPVAKLLADPNAELTPLGGNTVWQLGLLELWLQAQGV